MANKAKVKNQLNHERQLMWLKKGVVMLPTKREELAILMAVKEKEA